MDDALTLLRLQLEWGADESLDPDPLDRLQPVATGMASASTAIRAAPASPAADTPSPASFADTLRGELVTDPPRAPPTHDPTRIAAMGDPPAGSPVARAIALAAGAASLEALRVAIATFDGCALRDTASNLVFAEGDPASTTLVIGEPPGREEDRGGHPFAGTEGLLLDQMLVSIGLDRDALMLTPLLPWRPPGGRPANAAEISVCLPFLHRLIVLLGPRRLVLFGGSAARAMLPTGQFRRRQPPTWLAVGVPPLTASLPTLMLPSLAEMERTPALRRGTWTGLRLLRRAIDGERMPT